MAPHQDTLHKPSQQSALEALLNGKTELAETRLAVTAVQIVERLRIRAKNLQQLLEEELSIGNKLLQIQGRFSAGLYNGMSDKEIMGLEAQLEQRSSNVQGAQRREDVECWRDLTHVMRDFLNAWEGFSRNAAKNRFISALPQQASPGLGSVPSANHQAAYSTFQNDNPITTYAPKYR